MTVQVLSSMIGVTMKSVEGTVGDEEMRFVAEDGRVWRFHYEVDCCGGCHVEDICGDLSDLTGSPLVEAEEVDNIDEPYAGSDSYTWTFYRYATAKGSVTVRWLGESNGYYSESVTFTEPS